MLIINGTVHTMEGLTIPGGYVEIRGDKIAGFGPMEECPKQWEGELFDAQGGHIQPCLLYTSPPASKSKSSRSIPNSFRISVASRLRISAVRTFADG